MYEKAEKSKENTGKPVANSVRQKKSHVKQDFGFVDNRQETIAQRKLQETASKQSTHQQQAIQKEVSPEHDRRRENKTGLPDNLKSGIENLSGYSLDDVKVHRNSDKPAQIQAHAYAQGTDIHLASGQENHLPHEAWHLVQQKQGRVKPTMQMNSGVNVNDDVGLEKEADFMGNKALQMKPNENSFLTKRQESRAVGNSVAQKKRNGKQGFGFVDNRQQSQINYYNNTIQLQKIQDSTITKIVKQVDEKIRMGAPLYLSVLKKIADNLEVTVITNSVSAHENALKQQNEIDDDDIVALKAECELVTEKKRQRQLPSGQKPTPPYPSDLVRKAAFVYNDSSTWEIKSVAYLNGTDSNLGNATDATAKIDALKDGNLKGNTRTTSNSLLVPDTCMHNHLQNGSWGIAFYYKKKSNYKIKPYVIDIASGRTDDNKYYWNTGGATYEPTYATLP